MNRTKSIALLCFGAHFFAAGVAFAENVSRPDLTAKDAVRVRSVIKPTNDFSKAEAFETRQGGAGTSLARPDRNAFSHFAKNLGFEEERDFKIGNGFFRKLWVSSPSSTQASDGLGPLFNARSCQGCHLKDGRGHPPEGPDDDAISMFLRLSVPPTTEAEKKAISGKTKLLIPEPTYGGQMQDLAVPGIAAEGRMVITYVEETVVLNGGETVSLRRPTYSATDLSYGPMRDDVMLSPRVAPQMIGLGLLEAVHPNDILAMADVEDADGNGISGKPSMVRDGQSGEMVPGRFGWKASMPSIRVQSAGAFSGDNGISTSLSPAPYGDCTVRQPQCQSAPHGVQARFGDFEATDEILDLVTFYSAHLAVPQRRDVSDATVLKGKAQFYKAGCADCHRPKFVTRRDAESKFNSFQLIWPYTDLLLHDMGEGLADGRPVGDASGTEWRTAPLWGIGLTKTVNGHTYFLHDGRARSLAEAILWHGGEAKASRDKFVDAEPGERQALIAFLESL